MTRVAQPEPHMLERFLEQIRFDAFAAAKASGDPWPAALLGTVLDRLEESGVFDDSHVAIFHREDPDRQAEVHAYSVNTDDDVLSLFYFVDANPMDILNPAWEIKPVARRELDSGLRRLEAFVELVRRKRFNGVKLSQPVADLVELVYECVSSGREIDLYVLSTGLMAERISVAVGLDGIKREVWDLARLARLCDNSGNEPLYIAFEDDYGCSLPCLMTPRVAGGIQVLLTYIPGEVLAEIYRRYRTRLLERNVRSFLQFTGKVNRGIRKTLVESPERFLPYNNGLSATASKVAITELGGGLGRITAVHDFQIVNGGQTTASIAAATLRDRANLARVSVAMKLTVVPPAEVDHLVPLISRYANTQNRIQESDFQASGPWHIALERFSRATWTEPTRAGPSGTRWYYERSRGQYTDDVASAATPAAGRRFLAENPISQKFGKTDLARFVMAWEQQPAIVCRGAQKAFVEFTTQSARRRILPPVQEDLRRIAVLAIVFRTAEKLCGELEFKGYRAQVVAHAVARLSLELKQRLPWGMIWRTQTLPAEFLDPMKTMLLAIRGALITGAGSRSVIEWCKKEESWITVRDLPLEHALPEPSRWEPYSVFDTAANGKGVDGEMLEAIVDVSPDIWLAVSRWARDRSVLDAWQRELASSLGKLLLENRPPTVKQAAGGSELLLEAVKLGFAHDQLERRHVERLRVVLDH
jgi:AIPR protein/abortive infection phage resistance-like protein